MPNDSKLRVAAIGDLHAHETPPGRFRDLFTQISKSADVLVLCGDLTNFGTEAEAKNLAADLQYLHIPAVGVLGNHDHESGHPAEVKHLLREKIVFIDEEAFELKGVGFVGVKGFGGGFNSHMLSSFGESAIKHFVAEAVSEALRLEKLLQGTTSVTRFVVGLHYSPIPETVQGEPPEIAPFLGCSRLAEVIDRFPVSVVFHGHAHLGTFEGRTRGGVPVFNCSDALVKRANPTQPFALFEVEAGAPVPAEAHAVS